MAAAEARRGEADWLRSPTFDGALLLGVPALALLLGLSAALYPPLFTYALVFDIWVLAYPHVTSTYTRIAFDRESRARHWFLLVVLPLITLGATAAIGAMGGAGGLFTAYYIGQTYHYTRQSYGIARAYRRRGEAVPRAQGLLADAVVYAFPVWGLLHRASRGHSTFYSNPLHLPRIPASIAALAGALCCALLALWAARELPALARGSRHHGHAAFVLSHVLITACGYLFVDDITAGWLIINAWHNAQYLLFVWDFNQRRFAGGPDDRSPFLSRLCQPRNLWAYGLFCMLFGAGQYALIDLAGGRIAAGAFPLLLVLHLSVNFHHYLVDGVVWKKPRAAPAGALAA